MRVLVVEDSRRLAGVVVEGLRDQGMAVDVAYDGRDAASKLDQNAYDVVVLDRDLPGLHGDTICRMITDGDKPAMVLMLTASGSPAERVAGLNLGADDYLTKPFHFPELVLRVRALARRQPGARHRVFRAAGVELDPRSRTATRDGPAPGPLYKGVRRSRSDAEISPRLPQLRRPSRAGMGRARQPFYQYRVCHHQPPATQAWGALGHRKHSKCRISHFPRVRSSTGSLKVN